MVYRGHDVRLRRPVCIKIFHQSSDHPLLRRASCEHFVQEAFALSQLTHPNTLRIYDFGQLEDESAAPFQVSELLEGGTLASYVRRRGPREPREALELLEPVAEALSEAHAHGIVHRDIKPSNIFLSLLGERRLTKLGDFGIAKTPTRYVYPGATALPNGTSMRLYSPGWAAPEQLLGEAVTPAADLFALGLVTAFVLAGKRVFAVDEQTEARERLDCEAHLARKVAEFGLPQKLADVIRTACRVNPVARYESADAFAFALREAVGIAAAGGPRTGTHAALDDSAGWEDNGPSVTSSLLVSAEPAEGATAPAPSVKSRAPPAEVQGHETGIHSVKTHVIDCARAVESTLLGRPLMLVDLAGVEQVDLDGGATPWPSKARIRVTLMPSRGPLPRINIRGLNCFVARTGARPTGAVDVEDDAQLDLVAPDRRRLDGVHCLFAKSVDDEQQLSWEGVTLAVRSAQAGAVLLDLGPGRELLLLFRGTPAARLGGHP